jgi:hypothetical protein
MLGIDFSKAAQRLVRNDADRLAQAGERDVNRVAQKALEAGEGLNMAGVNLPVGDALRIGNDSLRLGQKGEAGKLYHTAIANAETFGQVHEVLNNVEASAKGLGYYGNKGKFSVLARNADEAGGKGLKLITNHEEGLALGQQFDRLHAAFQNHGFHPMIMRRFQDRAAESYKLAAGLATHPAEIEGISKVASANGHAEAAAFASRRAVLLSHPGM